MVENLLKMKNRDKIKYCRPNNVQRFFFEKILIINYFFRNFMHLLDLSGIFKKQFKVYEKERENTIRPQYLS